MKKVLIDNLDKIHTTIMGIERIKKNLNLNVDDVVSYLKNLILDEFCSIYKKGLNRSNKTFLIHKYYIYSLI